MRLHAHAAAGFLRVSLVVGSIGLLASATQAHDRVTYEVAITNATKAQSFTPIIVITDRHPVRFFEVGEAASPELETLAEGGTTGPLGDLFESAGASVHADDGGLTGPGETRVLRVETRGRARFLSLGGMLLPTNDTFMALNSVRLPRKGMTTQTAVAYDAGTEENDQDCVNIPGPLCGGEPDSDPADTDEGLVYISNGFHDLGDDVLGPYLYDWRNPVAVIKIKRIR